MGLRARTFVGATVGLHVAVFVGCYAAAYYGGLYVAEYLVTVSLLLQTWLVYRRELGIKWRWPWRTYSTLALAAISYLFVSAAYVPSPTPFEPEGLLKTQDLVLRHYAIFLVCALPVFLSCSVSRPTTAQPMSRALVTRIL